MKSFSRAVRLALRHRLTLVGGLICSLGVAVLWGGNIGGIYPFVKVIIEDRSLQEWVDDEIKDTQAEQADLSAKIADLRRQRMIAADEQRRDLGRSIDLEASRLVAERRAEWIAQRLRPMIYRFLPEDPFQTLVVIVIALLAATIVKVLFVMANMVLVEQLAQLTAFDLRNEFFRRTVQMDLSSFSHERGSTLMSRFTFDMQALTLGLNNLFGAAVREPLKMIVCLSVAAFICWRLLIVSLIITPLAALLINVLAKSIKRANRRAMEEMSQLYGRLSETFSGIQTVKAFNMERYEQWRFHRSARQYSRRAMRVVFYNSLTKPITEVLGISVICVAMLSGTYLVLNQETHLLHIRMSERPLSLSALLIFYGLLVGAADPARRLTGIFSNIQSGAAAADRIFQMLDREPAIIDPKKPRPLATPAGELILENVHFHYAPEQPVLVDVNLRIPFGETVAVVGPNGCGKTTLVNMLPRFYDPVDGRICIGGTDVRDVHLADLRRRFGLVIQQAPLFDDTVMNNIRYGKPHASKSKVIDAARAAHAHGFIEENLDRGYDTIVGQAGGRLSGGQRQRIALARAILRDPEVLILDEATSQIDLESEQLIHRALEQFVRGRTTIMITHRLSTLSLADRIIVMEEGRVVDFGTTDELMTRCDVYRRLYGERISNRAVA